METGQEKSTIPVVILTGFLGSGKTSFLASYLSQNKMAKPAVIINEFGQFSLDHILVENLSSQINELSAGCLCCGMHNELAEKMCAMANGNDDHYRAFDQLIIETSGVADTGSLIATLWQDPDIRKKFHLSKVITLISAIEWHQGRQVHGELSNQLACSDIVIISKVDLLDAYSRKQHLARLSLELEAINPHAQYYSLPLSRANFDEIIDSNIVNAGQRITPTLNPQHAKQFETLTLNHAKPIAKIAIEQFMDRLVSEFPAELLRAKGLVLTSQRPTQPLLVQSVKTTVSPTMWLDKWTSKPQTQITVIHKRANNARIKALFQGFLDITDTDQADNTALTQNPLSIPGIGKFVPK